MKKILGLLILACVFSVFSCSDDDDGSLELVFRARYGGEPLVMLKQYEYADNMKVYFSNLRFFASNMKLNNGANGEVALSEIEQIILNGAHDTEALAEQGLSLTFDQIPAGSYNSLQFGLGIPDDMNSRKPADYPATNPLSDDGEYWTGWGSYVYMKTEGFADTDNDGEFELALAYHLGGSSDVYQDVNLNNEINITSGSTTRLVIDIDYKEQFITGGNAFNITETPRTHKLEQIDKMIELATNLGKAID